MRLITALLCLPLASHAAYRPPPVPPHLEATCRMFEAAAEWLADNPDDVDSFLDRYLRGGTQVEALLADTAVRQSMGLYVQGWPASVQRECQTLLEQIEA